MISSREVRIAAERVRSLVWDGADLIDWAGGGRRFLLSGEVVPRHVSYAYPFDAAVTSPSGEFAVIYTRLGTKGLILRRGKTVREINRSFYHADVYEYPVAILRLRDGREVLVHCPENYCRLEIEELESGRRLTESSLRNPSDFFHSRLASSPDGSMLLSAGWIWHPVDAVRIFDVEMALQDPLHLDSKGLGIDAWAEECSAGFDSENRLVAAMKGIENDDENIGVESDKCEIRIFDVRVSSTPKIVPIADRLGTVMTIGSRYLLGMYEFPRLIDMTTGAEAQSWSHIPSGRQTSSILVDAQRIPPPIALDPSGKRCAIADGKGITVLMFDCAD